ncbi:MAG: hypothetical protein LBP61_02920 [Desulfovibrio sp.]|nr:hypothetical protein [Desulfovibrio sp.]
MKGLLKTVLRILLWMLLALLLCGGTYVLCRLADIPPKTALAAAGLLFAFLLCLVLCLRAISRHRRRLQIEHVVSLASTALPDRTAGKDLIDNRWKRAIAILKTSYLGGRGNPVYALPWYMVMGKTGAGKSSAVSHCGLNAMLTDVGPDPEHASTRNCDWYFFREAVVLDTAGRYAVPLDGAADNAEWLDFLRQLERYRRREALNGLVILVAADTLYGGGDHLIPEARALRRRLDEIMRMLGAKFPVYLMVSKIDLQAGMGRVLESLSPDARRQCVGRILQSPDKKNLVPVGVQIQKALDDILRQFRSLCLFAREESPEAQPHRLLAWEEFKVMAPALAAYAGELFGENPYQETPLLRGIFFSSALRTDAEGHSRAFPGLSGLMRGLFHTRESASGFFLHDFFSRVLPEDRNRNRPVAEYLRWRSSLRTFAYAALLLVTFGLAALLSFSFQQNETILRRIAAQKPVPPRDTSMPGRLLAFEQRFRDTEQMEKDAEAGIFPSMGLNQRREGLAHLYRELNAEFEKSVLLQALEQMGLQRGRLTDKTPDKDFFTLVADLVWRFDLVSAARQGKPFADLLQIPAMPQGLLQALNTGDIPLLDLSTAYSLARYYYNGRWDADTQEQILRSLQASLARLPEIKGYSMHWLIHRASELHNLSALRGSVFWPGLTASALDEAQLDPPYTAAGFKVTLDYLDNLSLIIADDALKPHAQDFLRWYAGSYAEAWKSFAAAFTEKALSLAGVSASGEVMTLMSSDHNPFFAFALRMEEELRPIRPYLDPAPRWLEDLEVFSQALRLETRASPDRVQPGLTQRIKESVLQLYEQADNELDAAEQERHSRAESLVKEIQTYLAALRDLVRFTLSTDLAFNAVKDAMPDEKNSNAATAKLALAKTAALSLRQKLNPAQEKDSPLFLLDNGPLAFFTTRLINGASCHIQSMWEGNVLVKAGALSPIQLQQGLFAEQGGLARDFADTTLQYFFNHTLYGYEPQELDGIPIPFKDDFLHFLNTGLLEYKPMPQSYAVTVEAVPVEVNDDALEKPYAVVLSLACAQKKQELANYNSPASTLFSWQRDGCGDTNISIYFRSLTLNARYEGENGFVSFLHDFQYGSKTFHQSDFPDRDALLKKLGITNITLRYKFSGSEAVLSGARYAPDALPFVAAECRR